MFYNLVHIEENLILENYDKTATQVIKPVFLCIILNTIIFVDRKSGDFYFYYYYFFDHFYFLWQL